MMIQATCRLALAPFVVLLALQSLSAESEAAESLFKADFDNAQHDEQIQKGFKRKDKHDKPLDVGGVERALVIRKGQWEAPAVAVTAFHYYRIRCRTKVAEPCYVSVTFFDEDDKPLVADVYDRVDPSEDWRPFDLCVRGRVAAPRMRVRFHAGAKPLSIDDVQIERATSADVAAWGDTLASFAPVLRYRPPAKRWTRLPKTMARLRDGGKLRIVMLGDSICNDTSNSNYETLLQRAYPKSRIEVVTSVRSSTGCQYYQKESRIRDYVLKYKPNLLMIAGISHGFDAEAIRSVIRQVRAESECEIMVTAGAVTPPETFERFAYGYRRESRGQMLRRMESFPGNLRRMCADEKVEYLDMRSAWDEYVDRSYKSTDWFMRDIIHANSRGKQILGRILLRYFQPSS